MTTTKSFRLRWVCGQYLSDDLSDESLAAGIARFLLDAFANFGFLDVELVNLDCQLYLSVTNCYRFRRTIRLSF